MGLCAMENAPGIDQAMRFANISGQMQYVPSNAWVGEQNLNGLGLDAQTPDVINSIGANLTNVIGAIGQLRGQKKNKNQPHPAAMTQQHPAAMAMTAHDGGGNPDMTKWLIYGGLAIGAVVVLMMVMKKKKKSDEGV